VKKIRQKKKIEGEKGGDLATVDDVVPSSVHHWAIRGGGNPGFTRREFRFTVLVDLAGSLQLA
jgi:hypothetical protein